MRLSSVNYRRKQSAIRRGIPTTEAARVLNISQSKLCQILQEGQIPSRSINGQRVISRGALMEYQVRKRLSSFDDY
ncbi:helix-turn-helix domain-containing protein [Iningainema sp. BLCCT55]|uniref:Helix-turn-helix domain-containing protein n=2 Tax=Iningainema TaxID=1932705 RepID=A0A8J6Y1I4_9CYAN|nr:helix-turn-helix domain-containing protein [Iningainema tapete BLCC-T55]